MLTQPHMRIADIQQMEDESRPFVLEKRGGTLVNLSPEELRQRWEEDKCQASDRIVDVRSGKQFPAVTLKILTGIENHTQVLNSYR